MRQLRAFVRDSVASVLYRTKLTHPSLVSSHRLHIVTFHRVLPEEHLREYVLPGLAVTVDEFRWLIEYFTEHFSPGPLADLVWRWSQGERPAKPFLAITFDDGQLDNYLHARPVLEAAGICGTFYVPVQAVMRNEPLWHDRLAFAADRLIATRPAEAMGHLAASGLVLSGLNRSMIPSLVELAKTLTPSNRERLVAAMSATAKEPLRPVWDGMMSVEQLRQMIAAGHEIGSHSMTHPLLDALDDKSLEYEVFESRRLLESHTGAPVTTFCYPNGNADDRVKGAVRDAGYVYAVSTQKGSNAPGADRYAMTRCDIQSATSRSRNGLLSQSRVAFRMSPLSVGI